MKERTRDPTIWFQPSISTKNSTLNGSETVVGGSIIMPIDMVSVATTISMTRNGSTIRKPISKARRSSEIINARISLQMQLLPGEVLEQAHVLFSHIAAHKGFERCDDAIISLFLGYFRFDE